MLSTVAWQSTQLVIIRNIDTHSVEYCGSGEIESVPAPVSCFPPPPQHIQWPIIQLFYYLPAGERREDSYEARQTQTACQSQINIVILLSQI